MDYGKVLSKATENSRLHASNAVAIKRYSTEVSAPKKLPSKQQGVGVQSEAVRAFLAKRQQEEERKALLAEKSKQDLLELRSIARHGRKANAMAKRTKDNNFMSNFAKTAELAAEQHTMSRGGFSGSSAMGASRLSSPPTSSRQWSSLPIANSGSSNNNRSNDNESAPKVQQRRPPPHNAPPPMGANLSFHDLLKVAAKKQHEPLKLPRIPKKSYSSVLEQGRMMTVEEKRRFIEEQARRRGQSLDDVSVPKRTRKRYNPNTDLALERSTAPAKMPPPSLTSSLRPINRPLATATKRSVPPNTERDASSKGQGTAVARPAVDAQKRVTQGPAKRPRMERPSNPRMQERASEAIPGRTKIESRPTDKAPSKTVTSSKIPPPQPRREVNYSSKTLAATNGSKPKSADQKSTNVNRKVAPQPRSLPSGATRTAPPPPLGSSLRSSKPARLLRAGDRPSSSAVGLAKPKIEQRPAASKPEPSFVQNIRDRRPPPLARSRETPPQSSPRPAPSSKQPLGRPRPPSRMSPPRPSPPRYRLPPSPRILERRPMPAPSPKRRIETYDEDEYDEEMDDFIDDGPLDDDGDLDYSEHIKQIFGYDRSKYRYEPDDACMESSFLQQMKEEAISAKMGILEDLEDIQREEEEMKRRAVRAKKLK